MHADPNSLGFAVATKDSGSRASTQTHAFTHRISTDSPSQGRTARKIRPLLQQWPAWP